MADLKTEPTSEEAYKEALRAAWSGDDTSFAKAWPLFQDAYRRAADVITGLKPKTPPQLWF